MKAKKTPAERDVERLLKKHGLSKVLGAVEVKLRREAETGRADIVRDAFERIEKYDGKEGGWCGS